VELNNRETAMLVWLGVALVWMLKRTEIRHSLADIGRSLVQPRILLTLGGFVVWIAGCAWIAAQVGLWESSLVNESVYWFLATGFVLYFGAAKLARGEGSLRQMAGQVLTLSLLAEVAVNLVVMPLWIELWFLPLITALVALQVFAEGKEEFAPGKMLIDAVVAVIGIALLAFVGVSLITDPSQLNLLQLARTVALPVWMTFLSLPFIYLLGLWAAYELAFNRIDFFATDKANSRRAKRAMVKRFGLRARQVGRFHGRWQKQLIEAVEEGEPDQVLDDFQRERKQPAKSPEAWIVSRAA
jgi:hypothetical protein